MWLALCSLVLLQVAAVVHGSADDAVELIGWIRVYHKNPTPPTFQITYTQKSFDFHNISSWSGGGGGPQNITDDSGHPFAGRAFGGGERYNIRGTRAFGSGYPSTGYGNNDTSTIAGRGFPYGVWPLYWGNNFKGSDEYGAHLDTIRPGGPLVIQQVGSTWWANVTSDEVYHIITDRDTAVAIMTHLGTWCHVTPAWPVLYEPGNPSNTIGIENVFQYYRASSFAFAYKGYNNTFALNTTTDAGYDQSSPLPDIVSYSPLRQCVDGVIANALPIIDGPPKKKSKLALIIGLSTSLPVVGFILAFIFMMCGVE